MVEIWEREGVYPYPTTRGKSPLRLRLLKIIIMWTDDIASGSCVYCLYTI
jgi:hypothetical protein